MRVLCVKGTNYNRKGPEKGLAGHQEGHVLYPPVALIGDASLRRPHLLDPTSCYSSDARLTPCEPAVVRAKWGRESG